MVEGNSEMEYKLLIKLSSEISLQDPDIRYSNSLQRRITVKAVESAIKHSTVRAIARKNVTKAMSIVKFEFIL